MRLTWEKARAFLEDEEASSEVESLLLLGLVVLPLFFVLPGILIPAHGDHYARIAFFVNLPFP